MLLVYTLCLALIIYQNKNTIFNSREISVLLHFFIFSFFHFIRRDILHSVLTIYLFPFSHSSFTQIIKSEKDKERKTSLIQFLSDIQFFLNILTFSLRYSDWLHSNYRHTRDSNSFQKHLARPFYIKTCFQYNTAQGNKYYLSFLGLCLWMDLNTRQTERPK